MRRLAGCVVVAVLLLAAPVGGSTPRCCAPLPAGVTSWWPGNGNGADVVGGHDATLDGTVGFTAAMIGQGFVFDSTDDLVRVPDSPDLHPGTGSFTIDAWIKTSSQATSQLIARHYECSNLCAPGTRDGDWQLQLFNHTAYGFIRDNAAGDSGGQAFVGTTAIDDGFFHHVALVRDIAANKGRLFVDGVLQDERTLDPTAAGDISDIDSDPDPVTIGGGWEGGTTSPDTTAAFSGVIDEVHWWRSTALTGDQIAAICTDAVTPASTASAPSTSTVGQPITVTYTASDTAGVARVVLLVRAPGTTGFTDAATDSIDSGSFTYTPTTAGDYGFATRAEDASCGREAAPADPDAVTRVAAATTSPPPTTPPATVPPPKLVPITQLATLPSPRACVSRRHFPIHLRGVKGIVSARIQLTGVPARTVRGKALGLPIDLRGLPKGKVVVRITVTTKTGKRLVGKRSYHTCASRRIVKKH